LRSPRRGWPSPIEGQGRLQNRDLSEKGKDQARCSFTSGSGKIAFQDGPSLTDGIWHTVVVQQASNPVTLKVDGVAY